MAEPTAKTPRANLGLICAIFFCSGIPALIYQLVWQRSLFTIYGINIESVTVVVTAFMLGLGIGSFAVVGRSGGGPHALACAALLPKRVTVVASLVGLAPFNAVNDEWWYEGMTRGNVDVYELMANDPNELKRKLRVRSANGLKDPSQMLPVISDGLSPTDRRIVDDRGIRLLLLNTYRTAFAQARDDGALRRLARAYGTRSIERIVNGVLPQLSDLQVMLGLGMTKISHGWFDDVRAFRVGQ